MKILIIQENGRHLENRNYRECYNFKRSFERLGHVCTIWGLGHYNFSQSFHDFYEDYDVIFILENYEETNWIPDLSSINKFKVFWSIDSHCNPQGNILTAVKNKVDLVLCSIESNQKLFENIRTVYFPNAYPSDLIFPIEGIEKINFIGFCGTPFSYRESLIKFVEENRNIKFKKDSWVLGNEMVKAINTYKIHFNCSDNNDINYRVFETLGTKTCLVTSKNENLDLFFEDMVDLVMYNNKNELVDKIQYLQENENEIKRIAESGYKKVLNNHTYDNRASEFLEIVCKFL